MSLVIRHSHSIMSMLSSFLTMLTADIIFIHRLSQSVPRWQYKIDSSRRRMNVLAACWDSQSDGRYRTKYLSLNKQIHLVGEHFIFKIHQNTV